MFLGCNSYVFSLFFIGAMKEFKLVFENILAVEKKLDNAQKYLVSLVGHLEYVYSVSS